MRRLTQSECQTSWVFHHVVFFVLVRKTKLKLLDLVKFWGDLSLWVAPARR